jgi:hypothetical protein
VVVAVLASAEVGTAISLDRYIARHWAERGAKRLRAGPRPRFLDLPNVIGSPHNSAGGGAWRDEYLRRAVQNCRRAVLGETPWNLIGPDERML